MERQPGDSLSVSDYDAAGGHSFPRGDGLQHEQSQEERRGQSQPAVSVLKDIHLLK